MKGLIVDDEAKSRSMLRRLCESFCNGLEIVGEAASVPEALKMIETSKPDLLFLDIRMPVKSGFSLLEHFQDAPPFEVVFTTAYEEYALKAFKVSAIDYLLKPIEIDQLIAAYEKVKKRQKSSPEDRRMKLLRACLNDEPISKIALPFHDGFQFVYFDKIIRCEAQGNYTMVHLLNEKPMLITKTLKHYEDLLNASGFLRVHKSHLVNLNHIRKFTRSKHNLIEMSDGSEVEISPLKKDILLSKMTP